MQHSLRDLLATVLVTTLSYTTNMLMGNNNAAYHVGQGKVTGF